MLLRLETCFFVLALAFLVVVEGSCVYTIWHHPSFQTIPPRSISTCGYWISPTLPQCWLIGGLFILILRMLNAVRSGRLRDNRTSLTVDKSLLRQWIWLFALALLQGCALYLDSSMLVSR
jgi:hypothetical protein